MVCGAWWAALRAVDIDRVLEYRTPKIVVIRDRVLGSLRLFAYLCVAAWFFAIPMSRDEAYLTFEEVYGAVEVELQAPATLAAPDALAYCEQYAGGPAGQVQHHCVNKSTAFLTHGSQKHAFFVATRVDHVNQSESCLDCLSSEFITEPEAYELRVSHVIRRLSWLKGFTGTTQLEGALRTSTDEEIPVRRTDEGYDLISLRELLEAAGVDLDELDEQGVSKRDQGAMILVEIDYAHDVYGTPQRYRYLADAVPLQAGHAVVDGNTVQQRQGVKVVFRQIGKIGHITLQSFLVAWVSAMALIKASHRIIDVLLAHAMPLRGLYSSLKWEHSVDFKALREGDPKALQAMKFVQETNKLWAGKKSVNEKQSFRVPGLSWVMRRLSGARAGMSTRQSPSALRGQAGIGLGAPAEDTEDDWSERKSPKHPRDRPGMPRLKESPRLREVKESPRLKESPRVQSSSSRDAEARILELFDGQRQLWQKLSGLSLRMDKLVASRHEAERLGMVCSDVDALRALLRQQEEQLQQIREPMSQLSELRQAQEQLQEKVQQQLQSQSQLERKLESRCQMRSPSPTLREQALRMPLTRPSSLPSSPSRVPALLPDAPLPMAECSPREDGLRALSSALVSVVPSGWASGSSPVPGLSLHPGSGLASGSASVRSGSASSNSRFPYAQLLRPITPPSFEPPPVPAERALQPIPLRDLPALIARDHCRSQQGDSPR